MPFLSTTVLPPPVSLTKESASNQDPLPFLQTCRSPESTPLVSSCCSEELIPLSKMFILLNLHAGSYTCVPLRKAHSKFVPPLFSISLSSNLLMVTCLQHFMSFKYLQSLKRQRKNCTTMKKFCLTSTPTPAFIPPLSPLPTWAPQNRCLLPVATSLCPGSFSGLCPQSATRCVPRNPNSLSGDLLIAHPDLVPSCPSTVT